MANDTLEGAKLRDPLGEVARKERRFLLGISVLGIAIVKAGIVPTKLAAFGVEFGKTNQQWLLWILGFVILYFLVAFIIYSLSDYLAWRLSCIHASEKVIRGSVEENWNFEMSGGARSDLEVQIDEALSKIYSGKRSVFMLSGPVSIVRATFEFLLPIIVGIYTILLLWKVIP